MKNLMIPHRLRLGSLGRRRRAGGLRVLSGQCSQTTPVREAELGVKGVLIPDAAAAEASAGLTRSFRAGVGTLKSSWIEAVRYKT